jgi:hypothetical protein
MYTESNQQNGWNEYSKLVLKELESLGQGIKGLDYEIQGIKKDIAIINEREDRMTMLLAWKQKFDETITLQQVAQLNADLQELKSFRTKAVTVFAVIQFLIVLFSVFAEYVLK